MKARLRNGGACAGDSSAEQKPLPGNSHPTPTTPHSECVQAQLRLAKRTARATEAHRASYLANAKSARITLLALAVGALCEERVQVRRPVNLRKISPATPTWRVRHAVSRSCCNHGQQVCQARVCEATSQRELSQLSVGRCCTKYNGIMPPLPRINAPRSHPA